MITTLSNIHVFLLQNQEEKIQILALFVCAHVREDQLWQLPGPIWLHVKSCGNFCASEREALTEEANYYDTFGEAKSDTPRKKLLA